MLSLIFPVKNTHTKTKKQKQQTNKEIKSIKITTTCNNQGKNYEFTKAKLIIRSGWLSVKERRLSQVKVLLNFKFCILCRGGGGFSRHRGRCPESVWALLSATLIMTHSFPGAYKSVQMNTNLMGMCPFLWRVSMETWQRERMGFHCKRWVGKQTLELKSTSKMLNYNYNYNNLNNFNNNYN